MGPERSTIQHISIALSLLLLAQCSHVDAKRAWSSSSNRRTSSSSSSSHRRTSYTPSSSVSHAPNHDNARLSYGGSAYTPAKTSSGSHSTAARPTASPIGWNVPKQQGPPPAYSATNPVGGARTNVHEPAPAYKASAPPPNYSAATNTNRNVQPATVATSHGGYNAYRSRSNSTGGFGGSSYPRTNYTSGFGGGGYRTPITQSSSSNLQSSYPRQQLPAGATYHSPGALPPGASYHPSGSLPTGATYHAPGALPAGATYHAPGALPPGATYHPAGALPAGASYHPGGSLPAGATYHPAGSIPPGATYHPTGGVPAGASYYPSGAAPAGAAYYPSAPPGATFLPAGAALPAGATYMAQPPKSSGLGFGSGLAAGALGGALLGYALTPSTKVIQQAPPMSSGGGSSGGYGNGEDKIIIINNGPPGSVTTTDTGSGTTIINTGTPQGPAAPVAPAQYVPPQGVDAAPLAPMTPTYVQPAPTTGEQTSPPMPSAALPIAAAGAAAAGAAVAAAAGPSAAEVPVANNVPQTSPAEGPPAGGIICVPVKVSEPDPADATKIIEVEKIACYPAPPPETVPTTPTPTVAPAENAGEVIHTSVSAAPVAAVPSVAPLGAPASNAATMTDNVPLAPIVTTPVNLPEGAVPLAPFQPGQQPDVLRLPGEPYVQSRLSSAIMAEESGIRNAFAHGNTISSKASTLIPILVAFLFL